MASISVHHGDCLKVLPRLPRDHFDAICTDPPYHIDSIVKRFGGANAAPAKFGTDGAFARASRGFLHQTWDSGDTALRPETWKEVYDVTKPGGFMVAFSGTKKFHRLVCAIEDAGWEIRDTVVWAYGSGQPRSHQQHGAWEGFGTNLKPAVELIALARKPVIGTIKQNLDRYGTGALNIRDCRVEGPDMSRWPANLLLSDDAELDAYLPRRLFYVAKASKADRAGSEHATIKPVALIKYLCRLICPPGGLILDPFAGSGTTGQAAREEGFRATLIEREHQYVADIVRRLRAA